jgi:uncharacterized protein YciI
MWFLCQRRNVRPREQRTVTLNEHFVWMKQQHEAGNIVISGPAQNRSLGMYLIRAGSREEAEAIASGDPFTVAGDCSFDLIDWEIHQILGVGPFTAEGLGRS